MARIDAPKDAYQQIGQRLDLEKIKDQDATRNGEEVAGYIGSQRKTNSCSFWEFCPTRTPENLPPQSPEEVVTWEEVGRLKVNPFPGHSP
jgi:hypothetical protein